jgi:hypothetical protein
MKLWTTIFFVLCLSIISNANAAIGKVTELTNNPPAIQRQSQTLTGAKGTGVEMSDQIRTSQGKVGITFDDDTKVQVNENSKLVIDEFVYEGKSKGGKLAVKVAMGTVRYASGQIAKNSPQNVERDCKTGKIWVETDEGRVIMDQPFQATKVEARGMMPMKPVILSLSPDAINNMLILAPPKEFKEDKSQVRAQMKGVLDVDFLREQGLVNALEAQEKEMYQDKLSRNFLDSDFLANILDIVNAQLASQIDMLNRNNNNKLLPDWVATSGVTVELDEPKLTLCRDSGSDIQCVTTPTKQNSTITQIQGSVEIRNRVNSGGSTIINLIQR